MAKRKGKVSASQRDKSAIEIAKKLKAAGILSKQAKLHSGQYISKSVLKKTREYEATALLGYRTVKVPRKVAQAAKERGFQVVGGNKIIGPATPTFRNRLKSGELTGVKPVKGGMMEEVILPHTVFDMRSLVEQLEGGIDTLKEPGEQFAFKYHGAESYRAFRDSADLLQYLRHYKSLFDPGGSLKAEDLQEEFDAFTVFRLHPTTINKNIRGLGQRLSERSVNRTRKPGKPLSQKLAEMHPLRAENIRKKMREKNAQRAVERANNPEAREAYKAAARARAKSSYENRKGKKGK